MSERSIHKTIRISQEAYDYIAKFSGTTWNDQFNNMVEHVIHHEDNRNSKIMELDLQIDDRRKKLNKLDDVMKEAKSALGVNSCW